MRTFFSLLCGISFAGLLLVSLSLHLSMSPQELAATRSAPVGTIEAVAGTRNTAQSLWDLWQKGNRGLSIIMSMTRDNVRNVFLEAEFLEEGSARKAIRKWSYNRRLELDPQGAMEWAVAQLTSPEGFEWVSPLVQQWAVDDPDPCRQWLKYQRQALPEELAKSMEWEQLVKSVLKIRDQHPPSEQELDQVWERLEGADKETYFNYGYTEVDDERVELAWPLIHAARESEQWQATLKRMLDLEHLAQPILWPVLQQWLEHDFEGATAWPASLPRGKQREDVISAMGFTAGGGDRHHGSFDWERLLDWIYETAPRKITGALLNTKNLATVSRWLHKQAETNPELESFRYFFAERLAEFDTEAAIAWASSIQDEARRQHTYDVLATRWYRVEPWAAEAWAREQLGWSDEKCAEKFKHYR